MSAPDKCPKCGSGLWVPIRNGHANYTCNSFMTAEGGFGQDITCAKLAEICGPLIRKNALLLAQRDEAISHAQALRGDFGDNACIQAGDLLTKLMNKVNEEVQP